MIVVYSCVTYTSMYISIHACMNEYVYVCNFLQVCLEGQISRRSVLKSFSEGHQPSGDQIPWKFSEQFRDAVFPSLSGARIVRIATHPSAMRVIFCFMYTFGFDFTCRLLSSYFTLFNTWPLQLGYGSTAVELLTRYMHFSLFVHFITLLDKSLNSP